MHHPTQFQFLGLRWVESVVQNRIAGGVWGRWGEVGQGQIWPVEEKQRKGESCLGFEGQKILWRLESAHRLTALGAPSPCLA